MRSAWVVAGLLTVVPVFVPGPVQAAETPAIGSASSVVVLESPRSEATAFEVAGGLLTAAHAVDGGPVVAVIDGRRQRVTVSRIDTARDLALLAGATTPGGPLTLADRAPLPGEPLLAYGNGLGRGRIAVKTGIVSAVADERGIGMLETDAAVNPGDSGGPLVASDGSVMGLITARQDGEGAAVAVTAAELRDFLGLSGVAAGGESGAPPVDNADPHSAAPTPPPPASTPAGNGGPPWWPVAAAAGGLAALAAVLAVPLRRRLRRNRPTPRIVIVLDPEPEFAGIEYNER